MNKVFFFTGSRAEFGMYAPILRRVLLENALVPSLVVSGSHVVGHLRDSLQEVKSQASMEIFEVPFSLQDDSRFSVAKSTSQFLESMVDFLNKNSPSALVVYADRSETFAAALAAYMLGIPIVHIEGGDVTQGGALDDQFRHAITKFASLHFVSNSRSYEVVRQLGESPDSIFAVGGTSSQNFEYNEAPTLEELEQIVGLALNLPTILATIHPYVGLREAQLDQVFEAFEQILAENIQIILTFPNTDFGHQAILEKIDALRNSRVGGLQLVPSLGSRTYLGLLRHFGIVGETRGAAVGNSSSIVKDTPGYGCPAVLIGDRQKGRTAADNVLAAGEDAEEIVIAVHTALFDDLYRSRLAQTENPYRGSGASEKIVKEIVRLVSSQRSNVPKGFNLI